MSFKFAGIQLAVTSDKAKNISLATEKIAEAVQNGAQVISLPECWNSPYGNQYFAEYSEPIPGPTTDKLAALALQHKVYIIGGNRKSIFDFYLSHLKKGSIPEREGEKLYNTSISFNPEGKLIGKHRKVHLFDVDIPGKLRFIESETLSPGNSFTILDTGSKKKINLI